MVQSSEHTPQVILNSEISGVSILHNCRFTFVNAKFEKISGQNANVLMGRDFQDIAVNKDKAYVVEKIEKCENGRIYNCLMNISINDMNGKVIPVVVFCSRTTYKGVNAVLGTIRNATASNEVDDFYRTHMNPGNIEQLIDYIIESSLKTCF